MNKMLKVGLITTVLLLLTACGAEEASVDGEIAPLTEAYAVSEDESSTQEEEPVQEQSRKELRGDFAEDALQPASQLILGIFMLEDTEYAVDAELAPYLTPYWKLYKSLLESDTTAPEELTALIDEIQEVMHPDQVNFIASLELTQEDLMAYLNESGLMENMRPEGIEGEGGEGFSPPDGMPEGMAPGGGGGRGQGGGPGGGEGMDSELMATMQAQREEMGGGMGGDRMITPLINALIELLESKTS